MSQVNRKRKPKFKKAREFSLAESDFIKQYKEDLRYYQHQKNINSDNWYEDNLPYTNSSLEKYQRFSYIRDKFNFLNSTYTDDKLVPFFITVTLPSQYHAFKTVFNWVEIEKPSQYRSLKTVKKNQPLDFKELPTLYLNHILNIQSKMAINFSINFLKICVKTLE